MWYLIFFVSLGNIDGKPANMLAHKSYPTEESCSAQGDKMRTEAQAKFPQAQIAAFCISKEDLETS
jgi:hypothetical protein